jgi:hypothetical protein
VRQAGSQPAGASAGTLTLPSSRRLHSAVIISRTGDYSLVVAINLECHCFTVVTGVATINLLFYCFTVVVVDGMATSADHAGAQGILERRDRVLQDDVTAASALLRVVRQVVLDPHVVPAPETAQIINACNQITSRSCISKNCKGNMHEI